MPTFVDCVWHVPTVGYTVGILFVHRNDEYLVVMSSNQHFLLLMKVVKVLKLLPQLPKPSRFNLTYLGLYNSYEIMHWLIRNV